MCIRYRLDDSFSMSDHWAGTSAFDEGKQVVARLAAQAEHQNSPQKFTLLRFSRARQIARGTQPDLFQQPVDAAFSTSLEKLLSPLKPSETAAEPQEAPVSYTHLRAHETVLDLVCRLLLEKKKQSNN